MHEFIFSGISFQNYSIFDRKSDLKKINSKTGFQHRKPDFRFSISKVSFRRNRSKGPLCGN